MKLKKFEVGEFFDYGKEIGLIVEKTGDDSYKILFLDRIEIFSAFQLNKIQEGV